MNVTCKSILSLPYANQLKPVAGKSAMDNVISWVYCMEDPCYADWLKGGELVLITGLVTRERENMLLDMIDALYEKNVSGIIINLSCYIKAIPKAVIDRGDYLELPIFEMPEMVRIVDISQSICFAIFKEETFQYDVSVTLFGIMSGSRLTSKRLNRLEAAGYQQKGRYRAVVMKIVSLENTEWANEQFYNEETWNREFHQLDAVICSYIQKENCLTTSDEESYIWIAPMNENQDIRKFAEDFHSYVQNKFQKTRFQIGIGSVFSDLKQIKKSVESAQEAIRMGTQNVQEDIYIYDDMIALRLFEKFDNREELLDIASQVLKDLMLEKNRELLMSLIQFVKCGFNLKAAAEQLYIHENTMHYRMKKIASILKVDLKNYQVLFHLMIAVEILTVCLPLDCDGITKIKF